MAGQQGAAPEIGVDRLGHLFDGPVEDIGVDRAPQGRRAPPPMTRIEPNRPPVKPLDRLATAIGS